MPSVKKSDVKYGSYNYGGIAGAEDDLEKLLDFMRQHCLALKVYIGEGKFTLTDADSIEVVVEKDD